MARFALLIALFVAMPVKAGVVEVVGPFTIYDVPVSASLVAGGGSNWGWCNVNNSAINEDTAFSGSPIIDDGFCNGPTGTIVQVNFGTAVVNVVNDDLVFLDARFSVNDYRVSTDWDGYVTELSLPGTSFIDTGVDRSYFYEPSGGPFGADVMGVAFDLSNLGVPLGSSVSGIRFIAVSDQIDPLGIGSLVPEPSSLSLLAASGLLLRRLRRNSVRFLNSVVI